MKKTSLIIIVLLIFNFISMITIPVSASNATEYVLVAWDEEWEAHQFYKYFWTGEEEAVSSQEYCTWQIGRALYWFHIYFDEWVTVEILGYETWDSDDTITNCSERLFEAMEETGYNDGVYMNGHRATMLMAFTAQETDRNLGGGCLPDTQSMIFTLQQDIGTEYIDDWWALDNVIKHELSHVWEDEHCYNDCTLSYAEGDIWFYNEPLQPEWGHVMLFLGYEGILWNYISYLWCTECIAQMTNDMSHDYPPPPDPWDEGLPEPNPTMRIIVGILFLALIIVAPIVVILIFLVLTKFKLQPRIVKDKKSSFSIYSHLNFLGNVCGMILNHVKEGYVDLKSAGEHYARLFSSTFIPIKNTRKKPIYMRGRRQ